MYLLIKQFYWNILLYTDQAERVPMSYRDFLVYNFNYDPKMTYKQYLSAKKIYDDQPEAKK